MLKSLSRGFYHQLIALLLICSAILVNAESSFLNRFYDKKITTTEKIIKEGNQALKTTKDEETRGKIAAILASNYFYANDLKGMKKAIKTLDTSAKKSKNTELKLTRLYLESAMNRALKKYKVSRDQIHQALTEMNKTTPVKLKGKILYNAAALESDDPKGSDHKAISYHQQILSLTPDDITAIITLKQRSRIRLAKCYYDKADYVAAKQTIVPLADQNVLPRTELQYLLMALKIQQKHPFLTSPNDYLTKAESLINTYHFESDRARFEETKKNLQASNKTTPDRLTPKNS